MVILNFDRLKNLGKNIVEFQYVIERMWVERDDQRSHNLFLEYKFLVVND